MGPTDRLVHLGLPTLKYRRLRGDMTEVFKIIEHLVHEFIYTVKVKGQRVKALESSHYDLKKFRSLTELLIFGTVCQML